MTTLAESLKKISEEIHDIDKDTLAIPNETYLLVYSMNHDLIKPTDRPRSRSFKDCEKNFDPFESPKCFGKFNHMQATALLEKMRKLKWRNPRR